MNRQGRILVMDDLERWRKVLADTLRAGGYHVDTAATSREALTRFEESFYHLAVLDIRMYDPDQTNVEGMDLLDELSGSGILSATEVIVLSAYGNMAQMRSAFSQYKVADFLDKNDFDNLEFLRRVNEIFDVKVRINPNLTIHWQQVGGPNEVVVNLEIGNQRVRRNTPIQIRAASELEDLLCRLFFKAESVLVRPLMRGASGASVLWAQPSYHQAGSGLPFVVKFGDFRKIDQEYGNFKAYVQPFIGGGRTTTVIDLRQTPQLGGIMYSLLGTSGDRLEDFGSYYKRSALDQIKTVLESLFFDTCGAWYASPGRRQPLRLSVDYQEQLGFTNERLDEAFNERLKSVQGKARLQFRSLPGERRFTNPIVAANGLSLVESTYRCTTHGDLNHQNILVDEIGHPWLIDFFRTSPGHILRDVAELDTAIRIQLLSPEEATLEERLQMETTLLGCERFSQVNRLFNDFPSVNQALAKAFATVVHLRTIAQRLVSANPTDSMREYYVASFYYALNMIRFNWLQPVQREHALLSASLLADRLGL